MPVNNAQHCGIELLSIEEVSETLVFFSASKFSRVSLGFPVVQHLVKLKDFLLKFEYSLLCLIDSRGQHFD